MNRTQLHDSIIKNSQFTFARSGGNGGQNCAGVVHSQKKNQDKAYTGK